MKILHTGTLDVNAGGPAMSTYYTLWGLQQQGVEAELLMYPLSEGGRLRGDQVRVHFAKAPWEHKLAFSPTLKKEIKNADSFDIYHAQGVWQYPTYALADVAKNLGKPYVITPRGILYPQDLGLQNVKFTGFLSGKEKDEAIASLSVLAMPSEFENFGNVILEGLIRKFPCIATKGAPWQELATYHCGWWVDYSQEGITSAIEKALNTSREELAIMGENGRALLEQNYTVEAVAIKMKSLYEWILKKSNKPEFIFNYGK
jgi:glycosyltransferase involved in cell wall biosynthesis